MKPDLIDSLKMVIEAVAEKVPNPDETLTMRLLAQAEGAAWGEDARQTMQHIAALFRRLPIDGRATITVCNHVFLGLLIELGCEVKANLYPEGKEPYALDCARLEINRVSFEAIGRKRPLTPAEQQKIGTTIHIVYIETEGPPWWPTPGELPPPLGAVIVADLISRHDGSERDGWAHVLTCERCESNVVVPLGSEMPSACANCSGPLKNHFAVDPAIANLQPGCSDG